MKSMRVAPDDLGSCFSALIGVFRAFFALKNRFVLLPRER
jgi:hypothetical protein